MTVGLYKRIVGFVQCRKLLLQTCIVTMGGLILQHGCKCFLNCFVVFKTRCLGAPLYLVGIHTQWDGFTTMGYT